MLLVFDVGNTKTEIGLHDGRAFVRDWRVSTSVERLPDETGVLLDGLLAQADRSRRDVTALALASVVPAATSALRTLAERRFGLPLFVLNHRTAHGVKLMVENPEATGPDRIANTAAVHHLYGVDAIVLDAGTALTFDVITASGEYHGGAISPGLGIAAEALVRRTARLPEVELLPPRNVVGRHTVAALRSGLVLGWTGLIREMVRMLKEELGGEQKVIATGGLARRVAEWSGVVDEVNERLTLEGIRILFERDRQAPA